MKRSAYIYLREGKYIITPFSRTTQRLHVMTEPIRIYEELPDLIKNLDSVLAYSKTGISIEEGERISDIAFKKLWKMVGVRSFKAYVEPVIKSVDVTEENGSVFFTPTLKEGKGFAPLSNDKQTSPLSDPKALIEALQKAIAACRVEEKNPPKTKKKRVPYIPIENGIAISKHMLHLDEEGYQKSRTLKAILSRYLNELVNYTGEEKDPSKSKKITARQLKLVVLSFSFTESQHAIIEEFKQKAKERGVVVVVSDSY